MKLVLPAAAQLDGVQISISDTRPLPVDSARWQKTLVRGDQPAELIRVHWVRPIESAAGWPVVLVRSDVIDRAGARVAARLHAFYELIDRACYVTVVGADDEAVEASRAHLLAGEVDWHTDELVALAELWEAA